MKVSHAEVEAAREGTISALVPVAELAEAIALDRNAFIRQVKKRGIPMMRVRDGRSGSPRWKLAITEVDAKRVIAELKRIGYGASLAFMDKDGIAALVGEQK